MSVGALNPLPYIVPESAFTSYKGIGQTTQLVATYTVPAAPFAWKPAVFGQLALSGFSLSLNPLLVGAEVLVGSATTGQLVGIGYGNPFGGAVMISPQTSSQQNPNDAMTPDNSIGLIPAGQAATFYVNIVNNGMAGVYDFNSASAQLLILAIPAATEGAVQAAIYGSLSPKLGLSVFAVSSQPNGAALLPVLSATARLTCAARPSVTGRLSAHAVLTCNAHT
jgi:hypothetical protein